MAPRLPPEGWKKGLPAFKSRAHPARHPQALWKSPAHPVNGKGNQRQTRSALRPSPAGAGFLPQGRRGRLSFLSGARTPLSYLPSELGRRPQDPLSSRPATGTRGWGHLAWEPPLGLPPGTQFHHTALAPHGQPGWLSSTWGLGRRDVFLGNPLEPGPVLSPPKAACHLGN